MARAAQRDHGGGIDAAIALHGGERADWLDLSTGINPRPYPLTDIAFESWTALPDARAMARLVEAARRFWQVPDGADILAAPGASALIAQIPYLAPPSRVRIAERTYNEHAASFRMAGWEVTQEQAEAVAIVHPNNPDGTFDQGTTARFLVIDESFCDIAPERSRIKEAALPGRIILKSFGKFWGLAGLRLGFAMAEPPLINALKERLGPWAVSGPALEIGAKALSDETWAAATRATLSQDASRLDALMGRGGARLVGGTSLFRLYDVADAATRFDALARQHILTRIFPYSRSWMRVGLPPKTAWERLESAVARAFDP